MKSIVIILSILCATRTQAQSDKYLAQIPKYNEKSSFEDVRYKDLDWKQFYKLEEANDLVDPNNYDFDLMNAAAFYAVNKYRASKGIAPLRFEPRLRDAASIHSDQMVKRKFFDHLNRYDARIALPNTRIELCGYQGERIAENIARNFMDPYTPLTYTQLADKAVNELSRSHDHNVHMLDASLERLGCAIIFETGPTNGPIYFRLTQDYGADPK